MWSQESPYVFHLIPDIKCWFFLKAESKNVCNNHFPCRACIMTTPLLPLWPCEHDTVDTSALDIVRGEPVVLSFGFSLYSLNLKNAFKDFSFSHVSYVYSIASREKVAWSVRKECPKPEDNGSQLRAYTTQLPSPVLVGNKPLSTFQNLLYCLHTDLILRLRLPHQRLQRWGPGVDGHG